MPVHRFRDISHHASVIPHTTLLRLARNGQDRKSPNLSSSRGLETPANQVIFGESIRVPLTEVDDCGHTESPQSLIIRSAELGSSEGVVDGQVR
jgi:hypothetical protein